MNESNIMDFGRWLFFGGVFEVPSLGEVSKKAFGSCPSHFGLSTKWNQVKTKLPSGSVFYLGFFT